MVGQQFLSSKKKSPSKRISSLVKLLLAKSSLHLYLTNPSEVPFTGKVTQKIVKLCRISQRTEAVIVKVKYKFHLESSKRPVFSRNAR